MKNRYLLCLFAAFITIGLQAQVTRINSNKSLEYNFPLSATKAIYVSDIDQTLYVTDGTAGGTFQLSADIQWEDDFGSLLPLDGKYIFAGSTSTTGREVYITDGTMAGTKLVKDINGLTTGSGADYVITVNGFLYFTAETVAEGYELWRTDGTLLGTTLVADINPGPGGSDIDDDVAVLNNILYFTAERPLDGRELWRTNGTPGGTSQVKDIIAGPNGSNYPNKYHLFSTGTYLLFMARTPTLGVELYKSDGTLGGTDILKDINAGPDSSAVQSFYLYNNIALFDATDGLLNHSKEPWKTDGTLIGTTMLRDINTGPANSTTLFGFSNFTLINGIVYFSADDGATGEEIWKTDGTTGNTNQLINIGPGPDSSFDLLSNAIVIGNKFIFPSTDFYGTRHQLWISDGTTLGTSLFKDFDGGEVPTIYNSPFSQALFQGNKFFFRAKTIAEGNELWISDGVDGTLAHTKVVKDINLGTPSGIPPASFSFLITSSAIYFAADNGTQGLELWKSDGTLTGTTYVADLVTGTGGSDPEVNITLLNGKILFTANDGDDPVLRDLYVVDGTFTPLPISLADFTVTQKTPDALLQWHTLSELNSKDFTIQRSYDGINFEVVGKVTAAGNSSVKKSYSFIDAGITGRGKNILYYRLVSTDIDGKWSQSPVITLKLKGNGQWTIKLLSNPVPANMKVLLTGVTENIQLSIMDMNGRKLYSNSQAAINGQLSLPAANLPRGTYLLVAESGSERKTLQFVK